jgi:hypothetical protein
MQKLAALNLECSFDVYFLEKSKGSGKAPVKIG